MALSDRIALALAIVLTCMAGFCLAQDNSYALVNARLFNGVDEKVRDDVSILVNAGRIEEGFEADMILVPDNPLTAIEAVQDVLVVISNGQIVLRRYPFSVP